MIEKIGTEEYRHFSSPSTEMVTCIEKLHRRNARPITVAEIGVGVGATSVEIVKRLRKGDSFHFFSFEDEVAELQSDLAAQDYCVCELVPHGNSRKAFDSYCWPLAKLCLENEGGSGIFDLAYLDGAHALSHDGLACVLLKKLIRKGGYLVLDDLNWSFANSEVQNPTVFPQIRSMYTDEQINALQVGMVARLFMNHDEDWKCARYTGRRAVYRYLPR